MWKWVSSHNDFVERREAFHVFIKYIELIFPLPLNNVHNDPLAEWYILHRIIY